MILMLLVGLNINTGLAKSSVKMYYCI
uniref:Uncharacterized protein n=1 Tax=Arundo donax TaxID=35708 RepID=A0A0A9HBC0_ARUDO